VALRSHRKTTTYDSATNETRLDANDVSWTSATFTARYAVIWSNTAGASSTTDPVLGYIDFGADQSPAGVTFSISFDASQTTTSPTSSPRCTRTGAATGRRSPRTEPVASRQNFCELLMPVMVADQTAVAGTTEAVLWAAQFSALPANFFDAPGKTVRVRATGVMTTGATPGTLILTPRYGTTTGGTTLGAGTVSGTLVASVTPPRGSSTRPSSAARSARPARSPSSASGSPPSATPPPRLGRVRPQRRHDDRHHGSATGGLTVGATLSNAGSSLTTRKLAIESLN
jgi:hypothetical protein